MSLLLTAALTAASERPAEGIRRPGVRSCQEVTLRPVCGCSSGLVPFKPLDPLSTGGRIQKLGLWSGGCETQWGTLDKTILCPAMACREQLGTRGLSVALFAVTFWFWGHCLHSLCGPSVRLLESALFLVSVFIFSMHLHGKSKTLCPSLAPELRQ